MTPINQMPLATRVPFESITVDWAPDTREDCRAYHIGGAPLGERPGPSSPACGDVASWFGVTVEELLGWNPSLDEGSSCVLRDDVQYCVGMVDAIDEGMTEACVETASPRARDSCRTFRLKWRLSDEEFTAWNPVVGRDCEDFNLGRVILVPLCLLVQGADSASPSAGSAYCVKVEHFRAPGMYRTSRLQNVPSAFALLDCVDHLFSGTALNCNQFVAAEETRCK